MIAHQEAGAPSPAGRPRAARWMPPLPDKAAMAEATGPVVALLRHKLSLAEGLRAALTLALLLVLGKEFGLPSLSVAALAALMLCLCDTGGTVRDRLPQLLIFTLLGAIVYGLFTGLKAWGPMVTLPAAGLVVLGCGMARVWGAQAQSVGNWLVVVLALALDKAATPREAVGYGLIFALGGFWALLVTIVVWRINPNRPARRASAEVWRLLAGEMESLRRTAAAPPSLLPQQAWDRHARRHRRDIRDAIEAARGLVHGTLRARGPVTGRAARNLMQIEVSEQVSGLLLGLAPMLEHLEAPADRATADRALRLARPVMMLVREAILGRAPARPARIEQALRRMVALAAPLPPLQESLSRLAMRLRAAMAIAAGPGAGPLPAPAPGAPRRPWAERAWLPLRANLTWRSAALRHALRAMVVLVPALSFSFLWPGPLQHWLAISVVLTMQPVFASTRQRVLQRIGGTLLGAALAAAITAVPAGEAAELLLLVPLSAIGFVARQVSYGAYMVCLTPLVILFTEAIEPGQNSWLVAGMRALFTMGGGMASIAACALLWPSWEKGRIGTELRGTLRAHARLAAIALHPESEEAETRAARREAELAHNNLEAALSSALKEPGSRGRAVVESALVVDAGLRRVGGSLLALHYGARDGSKAEQWLQDWAPAALTALAEGRPLPPPGPERAALSPLGARLADQVRLLGSTLARPASEKTETVRG